MSSETKVTNFMKGESYTLGPLATLKLVCTSMICGQDQYYRTAKPNTKSDHFNQHWAIPKDDGEHYFNTIVSNALDADYEGVLQFVGQLRNEYMMRLNAHVILTAAIHHPKRAEFNQLHPNVMKHAIQAASNIPTDWATQGKLLLESKKPIPTIWKKTIAEELEKMSRYHAAKYLHGNKSQKKPTADAPDKSDELSLIDLIRLTHPKPTDTINELIRTGKVAVSESEETWERLRSSGKTWREIVNQIRLPHMALLRNLRNIAEEFDASEDPAVTAILTELLDQLVNGVKTGKQFPFRYYSAYKAIQGDSDTRGGKHSGKHRGKKCGKHSGKHSGKKRGSEQAQDPEPAVTKRKLETVERIQSALSVCLLESLAALPQLNGYVHCLSDNSGSARGAFVSEYGKVGIYEISNLSSLLTAYTATEGGSVWVFGDELVEYKVDKKVPILEQLTRINELGDTVGQGTETGVWLFWKKMIQSRTPLDTVFIYSDMQAGYGQLFADDTYLDEMRKLDCAFENGIYVDILSLAKQYREHVKHDVNLFSVQVAGYDNTILPDILYRGAVLSGWTGKESNLADAMIRVWDLVEGK
jgi:60 kDa SS-A/Ro ribonucleoprotein